MNGQVEWRRVNGTDVPLLGRVVRVEARREGLTRVGRHDGHVPAVGQVGVTRGVACECEVCV